MGTATRILLQPVKVLRKGFQPHSRLACGRSALESCNIILGKLSKVCTLVTDGKDGTYDTINAVVFSDSSKIETL
jgi:hypothetical protein